MMQINDFNRYLTTIGEVGFVQEAMHSLAYLDGLPRAKAQEIILFETGEIGQVLTLSERLVEVIVFAKHPPGVGTRAARTDTLLQIPVGPELIGQIIDPFGNLLEKTTVFQKPRTTRPLEITPPGIKERGKITLPLTTGVTLVDMLIPLGRGQRELVIGDRKTGKTNFLLQTLLNQALQGTLCIYAAVGKKRFDIRMVEEYCKKQEIMEKMILVVASSEDPTSTIFIAPYAAMSIAEYFKDQGQDVLLVIDDLSSHAKFYREIALLGRRFPGRNAYPADIFYTHARLLERAGNFLTKDGGKDVSITCLPVVETVQGDITGYIQTNLMSMTDGHIYFDVDLFTKGRRPAINPFVSVTRVGHQTQTSLSRSISRELLSFLTLREKLENFAHFGAEASKSIKDTLATGDRILAFFDQTSAVVLPQDLQIFLFLLLWYGLWKNKSIEEMKQDMGTISLSYQEKPELQKKVAELIAKADSLNVLLTQLGMHYNEIIPLLNLTPPTSPTPQPLRPSQQAAVQPSQPTPQPARQASQLAGVAEGPPKPPLPQGHIKNEKIKSKNTDKK